MQRLQLPGESLGARTQVSCRGADPPGGSFPRAWMPDAWTSDAWTAEASGEPGESWSDTELRLAALAASVGPLRRVMAAIAARLSAMRAWERLGYARLSDYARERPGISARQIQDLARVDRALVDLPAIERALVGNDLPWSKVRLLVRVAAREDESEWIGRVRAMSTRQLEREVRERAPSPDDAASEPERRLALRCTPAVREKWQLVREVAERVAGERLRAGEVLELVVAEAFSALSIDPAFIASPGPSQERSTTVEERSGADEAAVVRTHARSLPHAVVSLVAGLEGADAFELDARLRRAIRLEQTLDAAIAPLLRVVRSAEYEWRGGFRTLPTYARDELGISARKARALLRLERAGDVCPQLREAYRSGRLSWVKAQCLLPLLLLEIEGEWRDAWVEWAARVTVRRLTEDVERALLLRAGHHQAWQRCKFHPELAQDPIPPDERQLCAPDVDPDATQELAWRVPVDVALLFRGVTDTLRAKLERGSDVFDALLDHALAAWTLREPGARRPDPVIERDGYRCAVPGCTSRRNLHDHHVRFRSAGGSDDPSNRVTLCAFHHLRGVHGGIVRVCGRAPAELVFDLGLRSEAPPLVRYRSGDVAVAS